jgi:hypothetical protein
MITTHKINKVLFVKPPDRFLENEQDISDITEMIEFIAQNPVNGTDEKGRILKNHVDSTIMTPFQGTKFFDMIQLGELSGVEIKKIIDLFGALYLFSNKHNIFSKKPS